MEIERKFTIKQLPGNLDQYECLHMEQAYLCIDPVIRIRKENDSYYLTYKGKGLMARQEANLPLHRDAFEHLLTKSDGLVIKKKRYVIPLINPVFDSKKLRENGITDIPASLNLKIELDIFDAPPDIIMAEVEFPSIELANAFLPPEWFKEDVTENPAYHNSNMSRKNN